jgi:hypothetical protein
MSKEFDPYYKWLAIPPKHQPPNHYRLLGLELFESDPDVISDAAEQRMAHVRGYHLGQYMALSQRILNELAAAKVCLLNPQKKVEYDRQLRAKLTPESQPAAQPMETEHTTASPSLRPKTRMALPIDEDGPVPTFRRKRKSASWLPWAVGGIGGLVAVIVLMVIANSGRDEQDIAKAQPITVVESKPLPKEATPKDAKAQASKEPKKLYLADLKPVTRIVDGPPEAIKSMRIRNTTPSHGIQAHPVGSDSSSLVSFRIPKAYHYLSGTVGIASVNGDCPPRDCTPLIFRIEGDGKLLWKSRPMQKADAPKPFIVAFGDISTLNLFVDCPGDWAAAWALWIDPVLTQSEPKPEPEPTAQSEAVPEKSASDTPSQEVYRLTLQLSDFGDGKFRIEKTSQPPADDFSGTPFKFSNWPHTKATKGKDGMFRLIHDFKDADDLTALALNQHNLTVDKDLGVAVFTPGPLPEGYGVSRGATLVGYAKKCRLPITLSCDVARFVTGHGGRGRREGKGWALK